MNNQISGGYTGEERGFLRTQTLHQGGSDVKGTRNGKIWYREFQEEGAASTKALRYERAILRNGKEAGVAETLCMEGQW